jgi:hypothetical protein
MLIDAAIRGDRNMIKQGEKILKYKYLINSVHMECESISDTSNNRGKQNHFKNTQIIHEQHISKARN